MDFKGDLDVLQSTILPFSLGRLGEAAFQNVRVRCLCCLDFRSDPDQSLQGAGLARVRTCSLKMSVGKSDIL